MAEPTRAAQLLTTFSGFRASIDEHHDRRERIIKLSRDITALSKKMIFGLLRIATVDEATVFKEAEGKLKELRALFAKLAPEVQGEDFWRYERQVSPGIQEFLEAFTLYHYIQHSTLPTLSACEAIIALPVPLPSPTLTDADPTPAPAPPPPPPSKILITPEDYLGGIGDLTGELMRLAIARVGSSLGNAEGANEIRKIGRFVRDVKGEMDPLAPYAKWLSKKLTVLDQSLAKIEAASYTLQIRGAEFAGSLAMLAMLSQGVGMDVEVA